MLGQSLEITLTEYLLVVRRTTRFQKYLSGMQLTGVSGVLS
jgi:hypothetical protein